MAFTSLSQQESVFALSLDADRGRTRGEATRPATGVAAAMPAVSADGRRRAYVSDKSGRSDVWVRDVRSGQETSVNVGMDGGWWPQVSGDGTKAAFATNDNGRWSL